MDKQIRHAAELLRDARHAIALTGAGVSTPSGIPDFRSPGTGLWTGANPAEIGSLDGFLRDPRAYYAWRKPLMAKLTSATPNPAHHALAELERRELLHSVITQNIDGLHQRAGSRRVLEVHGRARELVCMACGQLHAEDPDVHRAIARGEVPYCSLCGGILKPNVVLFGEMLPFQVMQQVEAEIASCDLILVAGSSLEVQPACWWPDEAVRRGAQAIIINYTETYLDAQATLAIHADVAQALPAMVEALG